MDTIAWFDFSAHNEATGENIRAFSVNHPQFGNLIIFRGITPATEVPLKSLGFTRTQDGAWAIRAKQVSARALKQNAFPLMTMSQVAFSDVDLTAAFLAKSQARVVPPKPPSSTALQWLISHTQPQEGSESATFKGALPLAVGELLWDDIEAYATAEQHQNGATVYRGEIDGQFFTLERPPRLVGHYDMITFTTAPTREELPEVATPPEKPVLFTVSDNLDIDFSQRAYRIDAEGIPSNECTFSASTARQRAQRAPTQAGSLIEASLTLKAPLALFTEEGQDTIAAKAVLAILPVEQRETLLSALPEDAWVDTPPKPITLASVDENTATLKASHLAQVGEFISLIHDRGFDSVVYYRLSDPADMASAELYISPITPEAIKDLERIEFDYRITLPEGFTLIDGQGQMQDRVALRHTDTGEYVTRDGARWFTGADDAIDALTLDENRALADATADPQAVIDSLFSHEDPDSPVPASTPDSPPTPEGGDEPPSATARSALTDTPQREPLTHDDAIQQLIDDHQLPAETVFYRANRPRQIVGKVRAESEHHSSNWRDDPAAAAQDLARWIRAEENRNAADAALKEKATAIAEKVRAGINPSFAEWATLDDSLKEHHTYSRQSNISWFLTEYLGVPKNNIRKNIGEAAGVVSSDMGTEYPVVYFNRLAQVFGPAHEEVEENDKTKDRDEKIVAGFKIYPVHINGTEKWALQSPENVGTDKTLGDELYDLESDAEEQAHRQYEKNEHKKAYLAELEEQQKKAEQEEADRQADTLNGFLSNKSSLQAGKIRATMDKQFRFSEGVMTRREYIESVYQRGDLTVSTVKEPKIKPMTSRQILRSDQKEQDAHAKKMAAAGKKTVYLVDGKDLGKVAFEYASHLLSVGMTHEPPQEETGEQTLRLNAIADAAVAIAQQLGNDAAYGKIESMAQQCRDGGMSLNDIDTALFEARTQANDHPAFTTDQISHELVVELILNQRLFEEKTLGGDTPADIILRAIKSVDYPEYTDPSAQPDAIAEQLPTTSNDDILIAEPVPSWPLPGFKGTVYRGEHGSREESVHSRLGSITFCDKEAATQYALEPNDQNETALYPRVVEASIDIKNPLINSPGDPFIGYPTLEAALGEEKALAILNALNAHVEETDHFRTLVDAGLIDTQLSLAENMDLFPEIRPSLFLLAYPVLDNPEFAQWIKEAGFDGAIHAPYGFHSEEDWPEYKVFDSAQVTITNITYLNDSHDINPEPENLTTTPLIALFPSSTPQTYHVGGEELGLVAALLEEHGGRYLKRVNRYTLDVSTLDDIQQELEKLAHIGHIQFKDMRQQQFELAEGATFNTTGTELKVDSLVPAASALSQMAIELVSADPDDARERHTLYGIDSLEERFGLQVTNKEAVLAQYRWSRPEVNMADVTVSTMTENITHKAIRAGDTRYYIERTDAGWSACIEDIDGTIQSKPCLTQEEAIEVALNPLLETIKANSPEVDRQPSLRLVGEQDHTNVEADREPTQPDTIKILRGEIARYIGHHVSGDTIYEGGNGIRYRLNAAGDILQSQLHMRDTPDAVIERETISNEFTPLNAQQSEQDSLPANVFSQFANTSSPEMDPDANNRLNDASKIYIDAALRHRAASEGLFETTEIEAKRLENLCKKAFKDLQHVAAEYNRSINETALDTVVEREYHAIFESAEIEVLNAQLRAVLNGLNNGDNFRFTRELITMARERDRAWHQSLSPAAIHSMLNQCDRQNQLEDYCRIMVMAYGSSEDLAAFEQITNNTAISADDLKAFRESLDIRLTTQRHTIEIPAVIQQFEHQIELETSPSPIPNEHRRRRISEYSLQLAKALYAVDDLPITAEDIERYRDMPNATEAAEHYADIHNMSLSAARHFMDRISDELLHQQQSSFENSDRFALAQEAADKLRTIFAGLSMGDIEVEAPIEEQSSAIRFDWSNGVISIGRPMSPRDGEPGHCIRFSLSSRRYDLDYAVNTDWTYPELPTPDQLANDIMSFAERYRTPGIRIDRIPHYGEYFTMDSEDRYDTASICKKIRSHIKEAIQAGTLPKGIKVSVRKTSTSSISLALMSLPEGFQYFSDDYIAWRAEREKNNDWSGAERAPQRLTRQGAALRACLDGIGNAWNYDNSDSYREYSDFNYLLSITESAAIDEQLVTLVDYAQARVDASRSFFGEMRDLLGNESFYRVIDTEARGFAYDDNGYRYGLVLHMNQDDGPLQLQIGDSSFERGDTLFNHKSGLTMNVDNVNPYQVMAIKIHARIAASRQAEEALSQPLVTATDDSAGDNKSLSELQRQFRTWGALEWLGQSGTDTTMRLNSEDSHALVLRISPPQFILELDGQKLTGQWHQDKGLILDDTDDTAEIVARILSSFSDSVPSAIEQVRQLSDEDVVAEPGEETPAGGSIEVIAPHDIDERDIQATHQALTAMIRKPEIARTLLIPHAESFQRIALWKNAGHVDADFVSSTTLPEGSMLGVIRATGYPSEKEAILAIIRSYEPVATAAMEDKSALGTIEAIGVISALEALGEVPPHQRSLVIDDDQRALGQADSDEPLLRHYNELIKASGYRPAPTDPLEVHTIPFTGMGDTQAALQFATLTNGYYQVGVQLDAGGPGAGYPVSPGMPFFDTWRDAGISVLQRLARFHPQLVYQALAAYHLQGKGEPIARRDIGLQETASSLNDDIKKAGLSKTFEAVEGTRGADIRCKTTCKPGFLAVRSLEDRAAKATAYLVALPESLDDESLQTFVDQARHGGGIVEKGCILFANHEGLERFVHRYEYQYVVTEETIEGAPSVIADQTLAIIPEKLAIDLHNRGFILTDLANTWTVGTQEGGQVIISFHEGVGGTSFDVSLRVITGDRKMQTFESGWVMNLPAREVVVRIDDYLRNIGASYVVDPVPEPSIATITDEQAMGIILGAGLNIQYDDDTLSWHIMNGYPYRNALLALGGKFYDASKNPFWAFNDDPLRRIAAAISGKVTDIGSSEHVIEGYRLAIQPTNYGTRYTVIVRPDDDSDPRPPAVMSTHTSLISARLAMMTGMLEDQYLNAWQQHISTTSQEADHADTTEPHPGVTPAATSDRRDHVRQPGLFDEPDAPVAPPVDTRGGKRDQSGDGPGKSSRADRNVSDERPAKERPYTPTPESIDEPINRGLPKLARDLELFSREPRRGDGSVTYEALKTLLTLRDEKRNPTPSEKQLLANMVGLGSREFTQNGSVFDPLPPVHRNRKLSNLINSLPTAERQSLRETVLTAFYTDDRIVDFMWQGLAKMGVLDVERQLDIVDPGVGTGRFIDRAPEAIRRGDNLMGVECDPITAEIAQHLYPEVNIIQAPFQDVLLPPRSKDLFVGNPPYSDVRTYNPRTGKREVLHDLFLRESIESVREGGIVAFVTSTGTLDKQDGRLRAHIYKSSDLIMAYRLPDTAFSEAGTSVITDVLYFRKRLPGEAPGDDRWLTASEEPFAFGDTYADIRYNDYFKAYPEAILGQLDVTTGRFGLELTVKQTDDLETHFANALPGVPSGIFMPRIETGRIIRSVKQQRHEDSDIADHLRVGSLFEDAGEIRMLHYDGSEARYFSTKAPLKPDLAPMVSSYIGLRDGARTLIELEQSTDARIDPEDIESVRSKLRQQYDAFISDHGPISKRENIQVLRQDPDVYFVSQLEHYDQETGKARKADILSRRVFKPYHSEAEIETAYDACLHSISRFGQINTAHVERLLDKEWDEIEHELDGKIFYDPASNQYLTRADYLSGDIYARLESIERAKVADPDRAWHKHIDALEEAKPPRVSLGEVNIKLGAPWIPDTVVTEYLQAVLSFNPNTESRGRCEAQYNKAHDTWRLHITKSILSRNHAVNDIELGTDRAAFTKLLKFCLEQRRITIYDKNYDGTSSINKQATQLAQDKQAEIEESFRAFIFSDTDRYNDMEERYNATMNRFTPIQGDGSYLTFPGLSGELNGKPLVIGKHQLNFIDRGLKADTGLMLGHEAGGGKTLTKVLLAMKMKQLGIANKIVISVPNNILVQYTKEALELYPGAKILTVTVDDLTPTRREQFANKIMLNDWDLIIATHEQFEAMKMPQQYVLDQIDEELTEYRSILEDEKANGDRLSIKDCERAIKRLKEKYKAEVAVAEHKKDDIDFTRLGIDMVFFDEAHYLKNYAFPTRNSSVAGVQTITSQRARDAMMKFDWLREKRGDGRGVVLATGTFIVNTIGELMVWLRMTAPHLLHQCGIYNFDHFMANFGEQQAHIELTPDGSGYQLKTRLSKFHNIPELMRLFTQICDIKQGDDLGIKRPTAEKVSETFEMTQEQILAMDWLATRTRRLKANSNKAGNDNTLSIYNDLNLVSIDPRLIHHRLPDDPNSKVNQIVDSIYNIWKEGGDDLATQLIFLDHYKRTISLPNGYDKDGLPKFRRVVVFDLTKDIIGKLIKKGIPADEIASIHDCRKTEDRDKLFSNMRSGKTRICFGTTGKMGVGTNAQKRMHDLIHLSYPMRAADMEQRNKRMVRNGNMYDHVRIHYPTTVNSGDISRLQMLDRKHKMAEPIMRCDFENMVRSFEEDFTPGYEELMALTTRNPLIKDKLETDVLVEELERKADTHRRNKAQLHSDITRTNLDYIPETKRIIARIECMLSFVTDSEEFTMRIDGEDINQKKHAGALIHKLARNCSAYAQEVSVGEYRGLRLHLRRVGDQSKLQLFLSSPNEPKECIGVPMVRDAYGFIKVIDNAIDNLNEEKKYFNEKLDSLIANMADMQSRLDSPFPRQKELDDARKRKTEIDVEVMKATEELESKVDIEDTHPFEALLESLDEGHDSTLTIVASEDILSELEIEQALSEHLGEDQEKQPQLLH